jgi:hypothetical protein
MKAELSFLILQVGWVEANGGETLSKGLELIQEETGGAQSIIIVVIVQGTVSLRM